MYNTFLRTIHQHQLIPAHSRIVVGVSGGADSICLLHLMAGLQQKLNFTVYAATFNHGLRGDMGVQDVRFVQHLAQQWQIPVLKGEADVPTLAQTHNIGIEAAARRARYDFLASTARHLDTTLIAVAHHADDQAETILMHILRGAGTIGLRGMSPQSPCPYHADLTLIRPLIFVSRAQIERYIMDHALQPREDQTNQDTVYHRNKLRHQTFLHLREINPQVRRALVQLGDIVSVEQDFIQSEFNQKLRPHLMISERRAHIALTEFRKAHPALQRKALFEMIEQVCGQVADIGYAHILSAIRIATTGQVGAQIIWPHRLRVRVDYTRLFIEPLDLSPVEDGELQMPSKLEVSVNLPGRTPIPYHHWQLEVSLDEIDDFSACMDIPDSAHITLRTRRPGDTFSPLGMSGHTRKLNKWMIDEKIPQHLRENIPLLIINGTIVAILIGARWKIAESVAVKLTTENIVYFRVDR